jgi:hypothetical protein
VPWSRYDAAYHDLLRNRISDEELAKVAEGTKFYEAVKSAKAVKPPPDEAKKKLRLINWRIENLSFMLISLRFF